MAVLSAPSDIGIKDGKEVRMKMAAVKIYQGGAVGIVAGVGYATPLLVATSGMQFVGVALETMDNTAGSAGDKWIRVRRSGLIGFTGDGLTVADVGVMTYFVAGSDDTTVSTTPAAVPAGILAAFDSNDGAWISIDEAVAPDAVLATSIECSDITGTDASLGISGLASAQGGAIALTGGTSSTSANAGGAVTTAGGKPGATGIGGAVSLTGGIGGSTSGAGGAASVAGGAATAGNSAGGASSLTGGIGKGNQAGGAAAVAGGVGGATGAGGAASLTGGAGGSTSGTGGAVSVAGGAGSAGDANGGAASVLGGNANGSGTDGVVNIGTSNTSAVNMAAASIPTTITGPLNRGVGASTAAAGSTNADAAALPAGTAGVYPTTAADDTTGVIIHANDKVTGRMLFIGNGVANKILKVYPPSGGAINGASANAAFSSASGKGVLIVCLDSSSNTWLAM